MALTRQRNIKVQVTSADPVNKVFKGIYADSSYGTKLTSDKTYDFTLAESEDKELYIRYTQKPVKIIFKKPVYKASYLVRGTFGEINVDGAYPGEYEKSVEFPTDTTPTISIGFTEIVGISNDSDVTINIIGIKINDNFVTLPYSVTDVTPGSTITVEVNMETSEAITTTTTTTTSTSTKPPVQPAVLKLQSNAEGTVVEVTSDGIDPEEVSLAGTSQSSISIDMNDAPLVDV